MHGLTRYRTGGIELPGIFRVNHAEGKRRDLNEPTGVCMIDVKVTFHDLDLSNAEQAANAAGMQLDEFIRLAVHRAATDWDPCELGGTMGRGRAQFGNHQRFQ